jgi:hypothetical protein
VGLLKETTMPTPKSGLKARLMAQAEAAIDALRREKKAPTQASLADIEEVVLKAEQALAEAFASELLAESGQAAGPEWPTCPRCGRRGQAKGKRRRRVVTTRGEASVEREYYHCQHCRKGFFPLA